MVSNSNLTPDKKARLKREILEEIKLLDKSVAKVSQPRPPVKARPAVLSTRPKLPPVNRPPATISAKPKILPSSRPAPVAVPIVPAKPAAAKSAVKVSLQPLKPAVRPTTIKTPKKSPPKAPKKLVKRAAVSKTAKVVKTAAAVSVTPKVSKPIAKSAEKKPAPIKPVTIPITTFQPTPEPKFKMPLVKLPAIPKPDFSRLLAYRPHSPLGNKAMFIWGAAVFVVVFLLAALALNILGIYKFGWNGPTSRVIAQVLPLPAGKIDGEAIGLSEYFSDWEAVSKTLLPATDGADSSESELRARLFDWLVAVKLVDRELRRYGQAVTAEMLDEEMRRIINQIGSEEKALTDIKLLYGLDGESFKQKIIKPLVARGLLQTLILQDENLELNRQALARANEALNLARQTGVDFGSLVLQYTDDPKAISLAGDLGWFLSGELPAELENALFDLPAGTVYDQVVKDHFGYHIFKIENKLIDEEKNTESVKLSQILVTVNVDAYIKSLFDRAEIKRYIK